MDIITALITFLPGFRFCDPVSWLVLADWLEDHGLEWWAACARTRAPRAETQWGPWGIDQITPERVVNWLSLDRAILLGRINQPNANSQYLEITDRPGWTAWAPIRPSSRVPRYIAGVRWVEIDDYIENLLAGTWQIHVQNVEGDMEVLRVQYAEDLLPYSSTREDHPWLEDYCPETWEVGPQATPPA